MVVVASALLLLRQCRCHTTIRLKVPRQLLQEAILVRLLRVFRSLVMLFSGLLANELLALLCLQLTACSISILRLIMCLLKYLTVIVVFNIHF